jgi:hypothetical protein
MQYEKKIITILDADRKPHQVFAWQGVGTGLAYHHPIYQDGMHEDEYILVHVRTGACFGNLTLPTEPEAQAFLEAVAALDPDRWNISLDEYWQRYYYTGRVLEMRSKVGAAYFNALLPRDGIYLFAEDEDYDPIANLEVKSDDPEDARNKDSVAQIFSRHSAAVRVVLTRMDAKTCAYTDLHMYERSAASEAQS